MRNTSKLSEYDIELETAKHCKRPAHTCIYNGYKREIDKIINEKVLRLITLDSNNK